MGRKFWNYPIRDAAQGLMESDVVLRTSEGINANHLLQWIDPFDAWCSWFRLSGHVLNTKEALLEHMYPAWFEFHDQAFQVLSEAITDHPYHSDS